MTVKNEKCLTAKGLLLSITLDFALSFYTLIFTF